MKRCWWADPRSELYIAYHDNEWGQPEHDDCKLFEMLTLESFQAGLSWLTILKSAWLLTASSRMWSPSTARRRWRN